MFAPGASKGFDESRADGSDTAENTTGVRLSSVAVCMRIATGVATPIIRSTLSAR